jgi:WD40 repeat protein/transcriptional regulator with XRE-family HTH domain
MAVSIPAGTLEKFSTFGDLLRYLRRAAGLTQFELSVQVGYSHAQISRLEQNLRLPDIPTIEARFVTALGLENEPKIVARLLELAANIRREDAPRLGLCPYKGLSFFDEADADLFVGRETLTAKLTERVLSVVSSEGLRFLAVVGASGSGKSSLVRAGLVPALRWNQASSDWQIHIVTPTAKPLESLAASLTGDTDSVLVISTLMDDLLGDPRSLQIYLRRQLPLQNHAHALLVIDQFEELFALCHSEEERSSFIGNLLTAASAANGSVSVVITLRADFYAHCADYFQLRQALAAHQEYIGAMKEDELRRAIEEPARRGRWDFEPGLVDLLLHDVGQEPGALPLLSHALFETWQRRRGRTLTLSGYTSSGGVRGAIAETAETVFTDQFNTEQRSIARRIFLRLTELNDETSAADTRRRAKFDELILKPEDAASTRDVIKTLADARLIITSEDSAEVAHEALIREWPTLRDWLEENRDDLRLHRQLTESAQEWDALDGSPDVLYRGARLAQAREWATSHQEEMNELECAFLHAAIELNDREALEREEQRQRELEATRRLAESERQRAEEQSRSVKRLRKRAVYLAGAFIAALIMAFVALFFGRQAQAASRFATSRELAAASVANLDVDPERSVLLALKALDAGTTVEAEDALHRAVQASRIKLVIPAHESGAAMMAALSPDESQIVTGAADGSVKIWNMATGKQLWKLDGIYAAFSPDGKRLAVVSPNGTVKMIDPQTGKEIPLSGQIDAKLTVAFSPDGSRLLTVTSDEIPKIWDSQTGQELVAFPGHTDFINSVVFNPDGTRLLTASDDRTARVWDTRTGEQLFSLSNHTNWVADAKYSPDGKRIATISGNEAYIWDAESGERLLTLAGHKDTLYTVAFNADGTRLATGGLDRKIILWDVVSGKELFRLSGHTGAVMEVYFSQDGEQLISSSNDGTVRVWDVRPNRELFTIETGVSDGQIAFSADGTLLGTSEENGMVKIRDARTGEELQSLPGSGRIYDLAFRPGGKQILVANDKKEVRVLDLATGKELETLSGHTGVVNKIAFNPDGTRVITAGEDYKVKIWDTSKTPSTFLFNIIQPSQVKAVAFDLDGKRFITGINNGSAIVMDPNTGKPLLNLLRVHSLSVNAITFSPDGSRIATASQDGTAKIWDATSGSELFTLGGHNSGLTSIAYSPDGKRIATASLDGTAKLWDAESGQELLTFLGDGSGLVDIAFSPDGTRLATGSIKSVQVYLLQIDQLVALAKTRVTRELTSEECQKYLHRDASQCAPATTLPTTTPFPPTDQGRICQVTDTAGLYDGSFNESIYKGLKNSHDIYGWDIQVLQSASMSDVDRNFAAFQRDDCDLIVSSGIISEALRAAALANPKQKFLMPDNAFDETMENVLTTMYASNEASFLAGYVAASVTRTGKVGVFGGVDFELVTDFMDGFASGVAYYNEKNGTKVELLGWDAAKHEGLFVGGFCCAAEGRAITQQLLNAGADIILPVAGTDVGAGALYAVKTHGKAYIIGVDTDWAVSEPAYADIILTSVMKNLDVSVVRAVEAIEQGTFTGGVPMGTLETREVGLAPFYKFDTQVSSKVKNDLEQIKKDIIAGKIKTMP